MGRESAIAAGQLVYFHNHSQQGPPLVLSATTNSDNRWGFADRGYLVQGEGADSFLAALVALPRQGFYAVVAPIALADGRTLAVRTLVQVGYTRGGEAIVFPAQAQGNGFVFPERGFRFSALDVFKSLHEAGFDAPGVAVEAMLLH